MADSQRAMMRGAFHAPAVDEVDHAAFELDPAVGIADLQHRSGNALAFGRQELEPAIGGLRQGQQRHRPQFYVRLDADSVAALAMVQAEPAQDWFALSDAEMEWPVVAHEEEVLIKVHGIELRIAAAATQQVEHLHRLAILEVTLPARWNASRGQQRAAEDQARAEPLVFVAIQAGIVI